MAESEHNQHSVRIMLSFGRSSSPNFKSAITLASSISGYRVEGVGRDEKHVVEGWVRLSSVGELRQIERLHSLVGNWKSSSFEVDGHTGDPRKNFRQVQEIADCFQERERTRNRDSFCTGTPLYGYPTGFGCVHLSGPSPQNEWRRRRNTPWYEHGTLEDDNRAFKVDKAQILTELHASNRVAICTKCPAFAWPRVEQEVDRLPDEIMAPRCFMWIWLGVAVW
jgi:hypothetical protein